MYMTENQENILSQIMDTKNVHEKLKLLEDNRDLLDARMLGNLAVIFDILPDIPVPLFSTFIYLPIPA